MGNLIRLRLNIDNHITIVTIKTNVIMTVSDFQSNFTCNLLIVDLLIDFGLTKQDNLIQMHISQGYSRKSA